MLSSHSERFPTAVMLRFFSKGLIPDKARGFLPVKNPLKALPENSELHIQLNKIARDLPILLKTKKLREEIDALNRIHANTLLKLNNRQEKHTAILILTLICKAYIQEDSENPKNIIPAVISKNLNMLCKDLQRFPMLTYADYVLHNWQFKDPQKGFALDNIEPIFTLTGSIDEAWFIKIHVIIEAVCAPALRSMFEACLLNFAMKEDSVLQDDKNELRLIAALENVEKSHRQAIPILLDMKMHCREEYFYNTLRPYLSAWEEKHNVKFEGSEAVHRYKGASGAQSSILPALDEGLGVKHNIDGMFQHLLEFKQYMPHEHLFFIHLLKLRSIQLPENSSTELNAALDKAIKSVQDFRLAHLAIVHRYIYGPAAKHGISADQIHGTGGAPVNDFLGGRKQNTLRSKM